MRTLPFLHNSAQSTTGKALWSDIRDNGNFARMTGMPVHDLRAQNMVSRIRAHFQDAANRKALLDFLQTVPVPQALADWHRTHMDALWTALLTDRDLFAATARVMTDALPANAVTFHPHASATSCLSMRR